MAPMIKTTTRFDICASPLRMKNHSINMNMNKNNSSTISPPCGEQNNNNTCSNKQNGRTIKKKSVRFNEKMLEIVQEIPSLYEYTRKEIACTWYSDDEFDDMREDYFDAMDAMNEESSGRRSNSNSTTKNSFGNDENTVDGLDIHEDQDLLRKIQQEAVSAVLNEQYLQWDEGSDDPSYIADIYFDLSSYCEMRAFQRGLLYAKQAAAI